ESQPGEQEHREHGHQQPRQPDIAAHERHGGSEAQVRKPGDGVVGRMVHREGGGAQGKAAIMPARRGRRLAFVIRMTYSSAATQTEETEMAISTLSRRRFLPLVGAAGLVAASPGAFALRSEERRVGTGGST